MASKKYTEEKMLVEVSVATSWSNLLHNLGLKVTGGNHRHIQNIVKSYNINTDHFTGQGWSKGFTKDNNETVAKVTKKITIPDEKIFVENSAYTNGKLRHRLLQLNWNYECNICGISEWLGKPITLHLDHINGIPNDNRFENLRFLCPNCHQQTPTWGNKILKKKKEKINKNIENQVIHSNTKDYRSIIKEKWEEEQKQYIELILNSDIDFGKFGWVSKVARMINKKPQKIKNWMLRMMPEFYENMCFKRQ
jgi:hypothetical protein